MDTFIFRGSFTETRTLETIYAISSHSMQCFASKVNDAFASYSYTFKAVSDCHAMKTIPKLISSRYGFVQVTKTNGGFPSKSSTSLNYG